MDTVTKALDVLFHLHATRTPIGVTALADALSMPKANVHRLLSSLASRDFVERVEGGRYIPGVALIALGLGAQERDPVVAVARPELEAAAGRLGETLFLATARARRIVVLDRAEGGGALRAAPPIGQTVPVHATAMGVIFLAFGPELIDAPDPPFECFTSSTCTDARELERNVDLARESGYCTNREQWIPGLVVTAAPVRVAGRLRATVAVAAPSVRVEKDDEEALGHAVIDVANSIAERLEGRRT